MRTRVSFLAIALLGLATSNASALDVEDAVARMGQAMAPGRDIRASFEFVVVNAEGDSVTWSGIYLRSSGSDPRSRIEFLAPVDMHGLTVTVRSQNGKGSRTHIFLPSIRRVRDLQGDMRGESFLGTDFNYEDLGLQTFEFQEHTLVGDDVRDGKTYHRLESIPQRGWWYGKVVHLIDPETFLPMRTEYYDRSGELWKLRTIDRTQRNGDFVTPIEITMRTVPTGTATRIRLSNVKYNVGLDDRSFGER